MNKKWKYAHCFSTASSPCYDCDHFNENMKLVPLKLQNKNPFSALSCVNCLIKYFEWLFFSLHDTTHLEQEKRNNNSTQKDNWSVFERLPFIFIFVSDWLSKWEYWWEWDTISIPKNKVVLSDENASLVKVYTKTFETQFNKYFSNYWNEIHNFAFTSSRSFQKMFYLFSNTFLNFPQTTVFLFFPSFFLSFTPLTKR